MKMKIKNALLIIDAILMGILCLPGIIIGLPYLITYTKEQNANNTAITEEGETTEK